MNRHLKRRLLEAGAVGAVFAVLGAGLLYWQRTREPPTIKIDDFPDQQVPPPPPSVIPTAPPRTSPPPPLGAAAFDFGVGVSSFPSPACQKGVANALYVAPSGSDANPGTEALPLRNIDKAIERMRHGMTLFVRAGDYYNRAPDGHRDGLILLDRRSGGSPDSWLTVCGYPGERPRLIANDTDVGTVYVARASYIHVEGLELVGPAKGLDKAPKRGADSKGFFVGHYPYFDGEVHHMRIWNNWIHGFGASGIQLNLANNIDIRGNHVWENARWSGFATSGISSFWPIAGNGNDERGYGIYIVGNLIWNNYMDDSLFDPKSEFGLTDGNCIIIDEHGAHTDLNRTRTLVKNNVCVANGGTGVAMTRSGNADIVNNTFYRNNKTALQSVVNNGEFMCQSATQKREIAGRIVQTLCKDVTFKDNVIVAREDRKSPLARFGETSFEAAGNVWVKSGFSAPSSTDVVLENGSAVIVRPNEADPPRGDWKTIGTASSRGAPWPLVPMN